MARPGSRGRYGVALIVCCCVAVLPAQEANLESAERAEALAEAPSETPPEAEARVADLFLATLAQDVATADESELLLWARDLGLSTRGGADQLRQRILAHYGAPATTADARRPPADGRSLIRIKTARRTAFEEIAGEDTLRLIGGVDVQMVDEGVEHRIQADELILNLANDQLSARGGVAYTVTRPDGVERFEGELLVFRVEDWDGVFLRGFSAIAPDQETEEIDFSIQSGRISRSPEEIVVIDGGSITSSDADPPNYRIAARRIWLLAPGEWGLRSAVLYVGRVPTFYLPQFFLPGDRLFFHPSVGRRDREGVYVQTTTYIFGSSDEVEAPISLLRLAQTPDENDREREGLFLRIVETPRRNQPDDWRLRVLFDWYGRLGIYTALDGELPGFGGLAAFDFNLGIARTRNIYNFNGLRTPYYPTPNGGALVSPNRGWFLNTELPLRYETELAFSGKTERIDGSFEFRHFSDPRFLKDFKDRAEAMDWGFILSPERQIVDETTSVTLPTWSATAKYTPEIAALDPWITSLSLERIGVSTTWRSKNNRNLPPASALTTVQSSPDAQFFYPTVATFPELRLQIAGRLIDLAREPVTPPETEERAETAAVERELRPPWAPSAEPDDEEAPRLRLPDPAANAAGIQVGASGNVTLGYSLEPTLRIDHWFEDTLVTEPAAVDFERDYTTTETRNKGQLSSTYTLFGELVSAKADLSATQRYRSVEGQSGDLDSVRKSAATFTGFNSLQTSSVTLTPITGLALVYSLQSDLWTYSLTRFERSGDAKYDWTQPEWSRSSVDRHEARLNASVEPAIGAQSLQLSADIPPRAQNYNGSLSSRVGPLTSTLSAGFTEDAKGALQPKDLEQGHRLDLNDAIGAKGTITYDLDAVVVNRVTAEVKLGPFTTSANFRRRQGASFARGVGWSATGEQRLRAESLTFALGAKDRVFRFWRNRVTIKPLVTASLTLDAIRPNQSTAAVSYGLKIDVFRFLDVNLQARSENNAVYRYFPAYADRLGVEPRPFVSDILDGFRFDDRAARERSSFNLASFRLDAIHDLNDWELIVSYSGKPELDKAAASRAYRWSSTFEVVLRWKPIEELRREIKFKDEELKSVQ